jgi:predicted nucleic acid-binding protein
VVIKAVIDTNIWISALINPFGHPARLREHFENGDVNICRDKDDDLIIETAIKGEVAYLVTRDDDVKLDKKVSLFLSNHCISVLTVAKFLKVLE